MTDLLLQPLADAFMQVGVFVALLVGPLGWAQYRWGSRLDDALRRRRRAAPLVAAALTLPPGCAGGIIAVTAYARGAVSYGTAVAALTATMGDASWVLLAVDPLLTLQIKLALVVVGAVTGYTVDALGVDPRRSRPKAAPGPVTGPPAPPATPAPAPLPAPARTTVPVLAPARALGFQGLGVLPALLWVTLGTGVTVSLPTTVRLVDLADLYLLVGVTGAVIALCVYVRQGCRLADDRESDEPASLAQAMRHSAHEVAFVTAWVAGINLVCAWGGQLTGFDGSTLPLTGIAGVLIGTLVGLVPGCGLQIVFVGLYAAGGMSLPTLLASSISQDGDALLPLLAFERRPALVAALLTTVPAVAVGGFALLLL